MIASVAFVRCLQSSIPSNPTMWHSQCLRRSFPRASPIFISTCSLFAWVFFSFKRQNRKAVPSGRSFHLQVNSIVWLSLPLMPSEFGDFLDSLSLGRLISGRLAASHTASRGPSASIKLKEQKFKTVICFTLHENEAKK